MHFQLPCDCGPQLMCSVTLMTSHGHGKPYTRTNWMFKFPRGKLKHTQTVELFGLKIAFSTQHVFTLRCHLLLTNMHLAHKLTWTILHVSQHNISPTVQEYPGKWTMHEKTDEWHGSYNTATSQTKPRLSLTFSDGSIILLGLVARTGITGVLECLPL